MSEIGVIIRESDGTMLDGFSKKVHASSLLMTEALALKHGMQVAKA